MKKDIKISGIVIEGDAYGRKIGFPTVNLQTDLKEFPPEGVYAGTAVLENIEYKAGIVIGPKEKDKHKIEAHLLEYTGDAYGKIVELTLHKFLREFKKFNTEEELIIQIKKDLEQI